MLIKQDDVFFVCCFKQDIVFGEQKLKKIVENVEKYGIIWTSSLVTLKKCLHRIH